MRAVVAASDALYREKGPEWQEAESETLAEASCSRNGRSKNVSAETSRRLSCDAGIVPIQG